MTLQSPVGGRSCWFASKTRNRRTENGQKELLSVRRAYTRGSEGRRCRRGDSGHAFHAFEGNGRHTSTKGWHPGALVGRTRLSRAGCHLSLSRFGTYSELNQVRS